ncbi:hypothetical protein [Haliangium sp.]|uniref:hypothetical protein n=1 Tax=Haliangium sp. TaxID=2663208 RepID=UPI003D0FA955
MRCPHCAGEILDGSRFCGICGRRLASGDDLARAASAEPMRAPSPDRARTPSPDRARTPSTDRARTPSAEPARPPPDTRPRSSSGGGHERARTAALGSRRHRRGRLWGVLGLDLVLAGAGVVMILTYLRDCERVRQVGTAPVGVGMVAPEAAAREARP